MLTRRVGIFAALLVCLLACDDSASESPDAAAVDLPGAGPEAAVADEGGAPDPGGLEAGGVTTRPDGARLVAIAAAGSLQNPCFSPASDRLVITQWIGGYNVEPARVGLVDLPGGAPAFITPPDAISVNLPGACWSAAIGRITYSTDAFDDRDEIYTDAPAGGDPLGLTDRPGMVAFEPSLSPDGAWIVFESHLDEVEDAGAIFKVRTDGSELTQLTDGSGDDRQPNWSPAGGRIVFQSHARDPAGIQLFTMDPDGGSLVNVTQSPYDSTDASFSPDGAWLVYSTAVGELEHANLFRIPVGGGEPQRVTESDGYDGAPSWSPDGGLIAFEATAGDPDGSAGSEIYVIDAPAL